MLRIGEQRVGLLLPALDELVALSIDGGLHRFHRMQSLWFAIVVQVAPFIRATRTRQSASQRAHIRPTHPRARRFTPMRPEARTALDMPRFDITVPWTLDMLAGAVHLSSKQLGRVFSGTFGKTPLAYLTMLRVEEMSALLHHGEYVDARANLGDSLDLLEHAAEVYARCDDANRRLCNQAFFTAIYIGEDNDVRVGYATPFDALTDRELQTNAPA